MALFCDEAGKETDRYLAVGGIRIDPFNAASVRRNLARLIDYHGIFGEMKWNETTRGKRPKYQAVIDYFFGCIARRQLSFHCLLVDFQRFDHELRADGGRNESLKRMYFQLMLHRCGKTHGQTHRLYAFPDKANELQGLPDLKRGLNSKLRRYHGCAGEPFKTIEFRTSHEEPLLQLNDLILGGVCYQKNLRMNAKDAAQHKANLAGFILGRTGLPHYDTSTPKTVTDFTIWNLKSEHLKGGGS